MALETQLCEKHVREWSTLLPRVNNSTCSPRYRLKDEYWYLEMKTFLYFDKKQENWKMYFRKSKFSKVHEPFFLTLYVRSKTKHLLLDHKLITEFDNEIWNCIQDAFTSNYPEVDVNDKLRFAFCVDYSVRKKEFEITKRDSGTTPSAYLNDRRCLENLSIDFGKLMDGGSDPDVQLKCGDCTIPAHKLVLGARSGVFRTMLQIDMQESRRSSVEIVDIEPDTLQLFVRYLYTGSLPELSEDVAAALFAAGDKYQVRVLMDRCSSYLAENLTREKACAILVLADAHSDEDLKECVMSYILDEKIPDDDEVWSEFCNSHPKLAMQVFRLAYKRLG